MSLRQLIARLERLERRAPKRNRDELRRLRDDLGQRKGIENEPANWEWKAYWTERYPPLNEAENAQLIALNKLFAEEDRLRKLRTERRNELDLRKHEAELNQDAPLTADEERELAELKLRDPHPLQKFIDHLRADAVKRHRESQRTRGAASRQNASSRTSGAHATEKPQVDRPAAAGNGPGRGDQKSDDEILDALIVEVSGKQGPKL